MTHDMEAAKAKVQQMSSEMIFSKEENIALRNRLSEQQLDMIW